MTRSLKFGRKGPPEGQGKQVVVLVHGYGADGADLLGLADPLGPHMPDTVFIAPDAPDPCTGNPMGRQWFPIPWLDGSSEAAMKTAMEASVADLNGFLDAVLTTEGIAADRLILLGFSQGTMMSLHVAPRRDAAFGAVVGFSGRLMMPELLAAETKVKPPILLLHGDQDDVVPFGSLNEAGQALTDAGFETYAFVMKGTAHGIGPDGLGAALSFMTDKLGLPKG